MKDDSSSTNVLSLSDIFLISFSLFYDFPLSLTLSDVTALLWVEGSVYGKWSIHGGGTNSSTPCYVDCTSCVMAFASVGGHFDTVGTSLPASHVVMWNTSAAVWTALIDQVSICVPILHIMSLFTVTAGRCLSDLGGGFVFRCPHSSNRVSME